MARPIKETPVLEGKDARRFEAAIKVNETRAVPKEEYRRAVENFNRIKIVK